MTKPRSGRSGASRATRSNVPTGPLPVKLVKSLYSQEGRSPCHDPRRVGTLRLPPGDVAVPVDKRKGPRPFLDPLHCRLLTPHVVAPHAGLPPSGRNSRASRGRSGRQGGTGEG